MTEKNIMIRSHIIGLILFFVAVVPSTLLAQNQEIVQLTGVVVADDGQTHIPGVHIYVPSRKSVV